MQEELFALGLYTTIIHRFDRYVHCWSEITVLQGVVVSLGFVNAKPPSLSRMDCFSRTVVSWTMTAMISDRIDKSCAKGSAAGYNRTPCLKKPAGVQSE